MRVAVIGGGVAGMAVAQGLESLADVTLFEAQARLGGHTDTHHLLVDDRAYAVDSGFAAFNTKSFPLFTQWLAVLGVATRPSAASFAVDFADTELCYGTANLSGLFCVRRNLRTPRFLRMLVDILRFYRDSQRRARDDQGLIETDAGRPLILRDYLAQRRFGDGFVNDHLLPLCCALWSVSSEQALDLPLKLVLGGMDTHKLLQFNSQPGWQVIDGGANNYVAAFVTRFKGSLRLGTPVEQVERNAGGVRVQTATGDDRFDRVVFACHADQALGLIAASPLEAQVLGAFTFEQQRAVVHSDASFMPRERRAWSSWNFVGDTPAASDTTCWMNQLQSIDSPQNFFVTLNPSRTPQRSWAERVYSRPVLTPAALAAQQRRDELNGNNRSYFAGAYWGLGTHEDGFVSGNEIVAALSMMARVAA